MLHNHFWLNESIFQQAGLLVVSSQLGNPTLQKTTVVGRKKHQPDPHGDGLETTASAVGIQWFSQTNKYLL